MSGQQSRRPVPFRAGSFCRRGRLIRADRRRRLERDAWAVDQPQSDGAEQRLGSRWQPGSRSICRLRARLPVHRRPACDPWPLLPRRACSLPLLARAGLQLLAPRRRRDTAACAVRGSPAPTRSTHHARRGSLPVAASALRGREHLRCPRTRARTARTGSSVAAAERDRAHCSLARPERRQPAKPPLPDSDRRLRRRSACSPSSAAPGATSQETSRTHPPL